MKGQQRLQQLFHQVDTHPQDQHLTNTKTTMSASTAPTQDNTKPYFPLAGGANDGWSKEDEATATCFCGAVQLAFVSSTSSQDTCVLL
jgi:hypothetical protein